MEWRLFDEGRPPGFTQPDFFQHYPWIDPTFQPGFRGRIRLAAEVAAAHARKHDLGTLSDLGCGDGSLLLLVRDLYPFVSAWGYDLGIQNVEQARAKGLAVTQADVFEDEISYGDLIACTEMVEHLVDPRGFLRALPGEHLLISSPAYETDENHYEHHAWAWDMPGYAEMVRDSGWTPVDHQLSAEGFQVLAAIR